MALQPAVHKFSGRALISDPRAGSVHKFSGRALVSTRTFPRLGVTGDEALRKAIYDDTKFLATAQTLLIGEPVVVEDDTWANTKVVITAGQGIPYSGSMDLRYTRYSLAVLADKVGEVSLSGISSVHALIPAINQATGLVLTTRDLADASIEEGVFFKAIEAAPGSYFFTPGSRVTVGSVPDLATVMVKKQLTGFEPT